MAAGNVVRVLASIPWDQVVDAAPKIAEGAGRLWDATKDLRTPKTLSSDAPVSGQATEMDQVKTRLSDLEGTVQEMREQMQASASVIKDLADQNALLVQRIELARLRLIRAVIAGSACIAVLSVAVGYLLISR